jgi:hypothetical protein
VQNNHPSSAKKLVLTFLKVAPVVIIDSIRTEYCGDGTLVSVL